MEWRAFRGRPLWCLALKKGITLRNVSNVSGWHVLRVIKSQSVNGTCGRFSLPVISFVDTAGAFPGRGAEERGQAEAIASAIRSCLKLPTPMVAAIMVRV